MTGKEYHRFSELLKGWKQDLRVAENKASVSNITETDKLYLNGQVQIFAQAIRGLETLLTELNS